MILTSNPYSGCDWFSFIRTFFLRMTLLIKGESSLASD